jgi:hypothetical protein
MTALGQHKITSINNSNSHSKIIDPKILIDLFSDRYRTAFTGTFAVMCGKKNLFKATMADLINNGIIYQLQLPVTSVSDPDPYPDLDPH